jgi:hypothetical protein
MSIRNILAVTVVGSLLAACGGGGGGDINLEPTTVDNSVDNSVTDGGGDTSNNPCASYTVGEIVEQGDYDGTNCTYSSGFVGESNPLTTDLTIPLLSTGAHIFQDSLFVGTDVSPSDIAGGTAVPQEGEGPTLTIDAGTTMVFINPSDYIRINRGSKIIAEGTPAAPITMTSFADAVSDTAGDAAVSLWGGLQINGNGITNNCTDAERTNGTCAVQTEGSESYYGGNNNAESSGVMRYVVVKHSGFEVTEGDELNGITFYAVGSGTIVEYIQVHATKDDGLEFFGGAVNVKYPVLSLVQDDSLDWSDGYVGNIQFPLIIAGESNRCIEGDNVSDSRVSDPNSAAIAEWLITPLSNPVIANMTCITSANDDNNAGNDSEGILLRHGTTGKIFNSIVTSPGFVEGNECLELNTNATGQNALDGTLDIQGSVLACEEPAKGELVAGGQSVEAWFLEAAKSNFILSHTDAQDVAPVLDGIYTTFTDAPVGLPADDFFETVDYRGAVSASDDWTNGWVFRGGWPTYTE